MTAPVAVMFNNQKSEPGSHREEKSIDVSLRGFWAQERLLLVHVFAAVAVTFFVVLWLFGDQGIAGQQQG